MKSRIEDDIEFIDEVVSETMKHNGCDEETASACLLMTIAESYLKGEGDVDVLDLILSYTLLDKLWTKELSLRIFHDIYHSPLFEEVTETSRLWMLDEKIARRAPFSVAERYFDLFYKNGGEDTETFLWRCLCAGCFPDKSFLRKNEEEKRETFTKDMHWRLFLDLFSLSDEERELAINSAPLDLAPEDLKKDLLHQG